LARVGRRAPRSDAAGRSAGQGGRPDRTPRTKKDHEINPFTLGSARRRPTVTTALIALAGLAALGVPRWSEATNDPCGRVYLVNANNELLRLRAPPCTETRADVPSEDEAAANLP
jgi:hypothetical protein